MILRIQIKDIYIIQLSIVYLYLRIILPGPACVTVAGPAVAGSPCIFPFTYQGQTYTKCAKYLDSNQVKELTRYDRFL